MVDQSIVAYIRQAIQNGQNISTLRQDLISKGYNQYSVDEAINFISTSTSHVHHTVKLSTSAILAILFIVMGIGLAIYLTTLVFDSNGTPEKLLDLETKSVKSSVKQGETFTFLVQLFNMGNDKRYDVTVKTEIIDYDSNIITQKEDTFAIERRTTTTMQIEIPQDTDPGMYTLRSSASYPGGIAVSSFNFRIDKSTPSQRDNPEETETCSDNIRNQDEVGVDCGGPCDPCIINQEESCYDNIKNQDEEGIDCGGSCVKECEVSCGDCDDDNPCTEDRCENSRCLSIPLSPCCGDSICEKNEDEDNCPKDCEGEEPGESNPITTSGEDPKKIIELVESVGIEDPKRAATMCRSLEEERDSDRCFEVLADASSKYLYCNQIQSIIKRDGCYMNFAMDGDYSVCDKVENTYLKSACDSLKYYPKKEDID